MTTETECVQIDFRKRLVMWLGRNPWVLYTPWLFGVVLAVSLPDNVLTKYEWLRPWAGFVSDVFPYITRAADHSRFPEVTRVFHAAMWTLAPAWLFLCLITPIDRPAPEKRHMWARAVLVFMVCFSFLHSFDGSLTSMEKTVSHSRIGLGLVGTLMHSGGAVFVILILIWTVRDLNNASHFKDNQGGDHV